MKYLFRLAFLAMSLVAAAPASAQLFKCKGADGKVVYSDQRCDAASTDTKLKGVTNAPSSAAVAAPSAAPQPSALPPASARELSGPNGSAAAEPHARRDGPRELTYGQRERIRNLEVTMGSSARPEQKEAARLEIAAIRDGREDKLSSSDRDRRQSLVTDLDSIDHNKRRAAMSELRSLYNR